ncbi:MAG: hypothetical protein SVK54_04830 [candidate division WOR-3 bacterium]|nr:hypothetical protein [candidate division WOR-3 bacterium]
MNRRIPVFFFLFISTIITAGQYHNPAVYLDELEGYKLVYSKLLTMESNAQRMVITEYTDNVKDRKRIDMKTGPSGSISIIIKPDSVFVVYKAGNTYFTMEREEDELLFTLFKLNMFQSLDMAGNLPDSFIVSREDNSNGSTVRYSMKMDTMVSFLEVSISADSLIRAIRILDSYGQTISENIFKGYRNNIPHNITNTISVDGYSYKETMLISQFDDSFIPADTIFEFDREGMKERDFDELLNAVQ